MLSNMSAFGLSVLVLPTRVFSKVMVSCDRPSCQMAPDESATETIPDPSMATATGANERGMVARSFRPPRACTTRSSMLL